MTFDIVKHRSLRAHFPRLRRHTYRGTSADSTKYNCLAWVVGETHRRWDPSRSRSKRNYWPTESRSSSLSDAVVAYETIGFVPVDAAIWKAGWQTIALYAREGALTHAARLLENGHWTSKLGDDIDIEHDTLDALAGGLFGEPAVTLQRPLGPGPSV